MKITSVSYKRLFPIQQYVNETIGVEIQVDENDNPDEVMEKARQMVNGWSIQARFPPELLRHEPLEVKTPREFTKLVQVPDGPSESDIKKAIDNSTTTEELGKLRPDLPLSLKTYYIKKLDELSKTTIS